MLKHDQSHDHYAKGKESNKKYIEDAELTNGKVTNEEHDEKTQPNDSM